MNSQFAELYEKTIQQFKEGEVVRGKIVALRANEAVVDIGYKAEGLISFDEFSDPSEIKEGAEIDVLFEAFEDEQGLVVISKKKADRQRTWNELLASAEEGNIVQGKIFKKVRGGFMVDIGMEAFLPASLVDVKPTRNLDQFLGLSGSLMIVKINHKRKNVVVSRKDYMEQEKSEARNRKLDHLKVGDVVSGKVKNITDFGAFIDLGDLDGLLHITDMSWGRISHPSDVVKLSEDVDVVIIGIDRANKKVSLGLKQKSDDPWQRASEQYPVGTQAKGKVVNILPYGAFIELEPGIEGLVHISEISWTKRVNHPSEILNVGEEVEVVILSMDQENRKISLGMKQTQDNPWDRVQERYPVGGRTKGVVRNLTDYGAFIELEPGIDGLIHISDLSWTHKVSRPSDVLKKGDEIEVMTLSVDTDSQKISLGVKQLTDDPWQELTKDLHTGTPLEGKITRLANFGIFVELENGLEGLVHISEVPDQTAETLEQNFTVGNTMSVSVLQIDNDARKIALTCKGEAVPSKQG